MRRRADRILVSAQSQASQSRTSGVIDHESPRGILGIPGTRRNPGLGRGPQPPRGSPTRQRPANRSGRHREREPDVRAIGDLLGRFIKAYNARDAKALGELFTPDAEIEDEDGEVTRGP